MDRHSDLSESENSEEDYAIMLVETPEREELLERSDDEEGKIECGDEIIEDVDIDKIVLYLMNWKCKIFILKDC